MANAPYAQSSLSGPDLVEAALGGNRRALARLLTLVESGTPEGAAAVSALYPHAGQAHVIGFTGSTGAGKSTLVNRVAHEFRRRDTTLAVVAVDPTSPFSGGAMLGDRLRMRNLATDQGVFIRSMASRGYPGGVARATRDVVTVFDALRTPIVLVETVGAGQAQVEVARLAHTVVLVEAPGMGDEVQALKAGLMEIADVIAVNKADRPEAELTLYAIRSVISRPDSEVQDWEIPVLAVSALEGTGIEALVDSIIAHRQHLQETKLWSERRTRHARAEIEAWLDHYLHKWVETGIGAEPYDAAVESVLRHERDPATAARDLLALLLEQRCSS